MLKFKEVTLADKAIIDSYVCKEGFRANDGTFNNYYVWKNGFKIFWCIEDGFLVIKANRFGEDFFMPPFGGKDEDLLTIMQKIMNEDNGNLCMHGVATEHKERIEKVMPDLVFEKDRKSWDYVYLQEKLATLSGRKLHGQKNHYNAFMKEHPDCTYEEITPENIAECLAFGNEWCDERVTEDPSIEEEREALTVALTNFKELGFRGGCLRWDGKVQAFSYGTKINSDTAVIHVEKAVQGVRGAYITMTKEFAAHAWNDVKYLNREEDMGLPGLRKAKLDLKPEFMVEKFYVHHGKCKIEHEDDEEIGAQIDL